MNLKYRRFIKSVKEPKDHYWRDDISFLVLKVSCRMRNAIPNASFQLLDDGIKPVLDLPTRTEESVVRNNHLIDKPSKADAVKNPQTRMAKSKK